MHCTEGDILPPHSSIPSPLTEAKNNGENTRESKRGFGLEVIWKLLFIIVFDMFSKEWNSNKVRVLKSSLPKKRDTKQDPNVIQEQQLMGMCT